VRNYNKKSPSGGTTVDAIRKAAEEVIKHNPTLPSGLLVTLLCCPTQKPGNEKIAKGERKRRHT